MHQGVGWHGQRVGQSHIQPQANQDNQEANLEPQQGHAGAMPTHNHQEKPANPPPHKTTTTTNPLTNQEHAATTSSQDTPTPTKPKRNKGRHPHRGKRAPWSTPLVSAFVNLVVVGGCWGVVLVVCFGCVLGGFLFCFCFVFCLFLFSFCVGGGGIVRFI